MYLVNKYDIKGTYNGFKSYTLTKGLKVKQRVIPHVLYEVEPGKQLQVDWKENMSIHLENGEKIEFNVFSATLGYSREHVFIYSSTKTTDDFIRCIIETFRRLGGVSEEVLTDNMSAIVDIKGKSKKIYPIILQLFKDLGCELKLCKIKTPQTKGKDENLKNEITRATNRQTAIKKEQLEALSTFQKNLEEYYKTFVGPEALVYERRTGQYRGSDIPKNRIVSISTQIKTMGAMFLNEPSAVSGQYGTVAKRVGNKIFRTSDKLIMYYVSALALYKIENLFKGSKIPKQYRRSRYHAMMLFRMVVSEKDMPRFNQKKMEGYCQKLLETLQDDTKCEKIFKGIVEFIALKGDEIDISNRKCFERKETTLFLEGQKSELVTHLQQIGAL